MDVFEAIYHRQSNTNVKPDPVAREVIEKLLEAAAQAPNHYKVRPWRFVVFSGEGRAKLGETLAENLKLKKPDLAPEVLESEKALAYRSPVVIAIGVDQPSGPKISEIENVIATACAAQNLLLAAEALGLATKWRTGGAALSPLTKAACGFAPDQTVIGFIYLGYPASEMPPITRPSAADRTAWVA